MAYWHVKHGADVVRGEVRLEKSARSRIALGVIRGNDAIAFEGLEVRRVHRACDPRADLEAGRGPDEQTLAQDCLAVVAEAPDAQALDVQRLCGQAQNGLKPIAARAGAFGGPLGQRRERAALRREPAFARGQGLLGGALARDVDERAQDGLLGVPGDAPRGGDRPDRLAIGTAQAQRHVVGRPTLPKLRDDLCELGWIHIAADQLFADDITWRDCEHGGCSLIDSENCVPRQTRHHHGYRRGVEQLCDGVGVAGPVTGRDHAVPARAMAEIAFTKVSRSLGWVNTFGVTRTPCTPAGSLSTAFVQIRYFVSSILARSSGVTPFTPTLAIAQVRAGSAGVFRITLGSPRTCFVQYVCRYRGRASLR